MYVHDYLCPPSMFDLADRVGWQNSNIIQLFSMLKKDDKSQQMVYYQVRGFACLFVIRWSFKLRLS